MATAAACTGGPLGDGDRAPDVAVRGPALKVERSLSRAPFAIRLADGTSPSTALRPNSRIYVDTMEKCAKNTID